MPPKIQSANRLLPFNVMRINSLLLLAASSALGANPLAIYDVAGRIGENGRPGVSVYTSGDAPADAVFLNRGYWTIGAAALTPADAPFRSVDLDTLTRVGRRVEITFEDTPPACPKIQECRWHVTFRQPDVFEPAVFKTEVPAEMPRFWIFRVPTDAEAKKGDPDFLLSGSYLASRGTKPIYAIEAKARVHTEVVESGWHTGGEANFATAGAPKIDAADLKPRDSINVDPDTLKVRWYIQRTSPWGKKWLRLELQPAAGEFSRTLSTGNFVPAGQLMFLVPSVYRPPRYWNTEFIARIEAGHNMYETEVLLDQAVDLSWYKGIARLVPGIQTTFASYAKGKHRWQVTAQYLARVPLLDEPFVRYIRKQRDPEKPDSIEVAPSIEQTHKTRHLATAKLLLTFSNYWGFEAGYRYGSEPPLFRFVDHRVLISLKFSSMYR